MIPDPNDVGLTAGLPRFRRAREYRLYDDAGRRYLDLWQGCGHTVLGHRIEGVSTLMKSAIDRGLTADLPSVRSNRLARALRDYLPSHPHVRVFGALETCLAALTAWRGEAVGVRELGDPGGGVPATGTPRVALWRPFWDGAPVGGEADALVPVLPFGLGGGPWAVCFRADPGDAVAPAPPVSPVLIEAAAAAVWALARHHPGDLAAALAAKAAPAWEVRGIYLTPAFARREYPRVYAEMLKAGLVLSPWFDCPSILPARVSPGERAALLGLLRSLALE